MAARVNCGRLRLPRRAVRASHRSASPPQKETTQTCEIYAVHTYTVGTAHDVMREPPGRLRALPAAPRY